MLCSPSSPELSGRPLAPGTGVFPSEPRAAQCSFPARVCLPAKEGEEEEGQRPRGRMERGREE